MKGFGAVEQEDPAQPLTSCLAACIASGGPSFVLKTLRSHHRVEALSLHFRSPTRPRQPRVVTAMDPALRTQAAVTHTSIRRSRFSLIREQFGFRMKLIHPRLLKALAEPLLGRSS